MNGESYAFALLTAVVGMGVVFFFLIFLSLVMVALRRFVEGAANAPPKADSARNGSATAGASSIPEATTDAVGWLSAALSAYLLAEERDAAPSATAWAPAATGHPDPWVIAATPAIRASQGA